MKEGTTQTIRIPVDYIEQARNQMRGRYSVLKDYICHLIDLEKEQGSQMVKEESGVATPEKDENSFAPLSPEEMKELLSRGLPMSREEADRGKPFSEYNMRRYRRGIL